MRGVLSDAYMTPPRLRMAEVWGRQRSIEAFRGMFTQADAIGSQDQVGYVIVPRIARRAPQGPYSPSGEELRRVVERARAEEAAGE